MSTPRSTVATGRGSDAGWSPGPLRPLFEGTEVHVWLVDLGRVPDSALKTLSVAERSRAAAIVPPLRRQRWVAARAVLRGLLGRYLDSAPGSLSLVQDVSGRPRLERTGTPHFSLSHSGRAALFAVCAAGALGVDIETRPWSPILARPSLAARLLGVERAAELSGLPEPKRAIEFLRAWVAHEAALKCDGNVTWRSDVPLPSPGLAALACAEPPEALRRWELRGLSGTGRS